jgi:FkbM family methyltransferase
MFASSSLQSPGLTIAPCRHGTFTFRANDMIGRMLLAYGEWAEQEFNFLATLLRPGDIVLDVGAHIGTLTVPLARAVGPTGRVFSFEAQRLVFLNLCANVHLNALTNVHPVNAVVAESRGTVRLAEQDPTTVRNSGGFSIPVAASSPPDVASVQKITLDEHLETLPACRLIKMDIEGHEAAALSGMTKLLGRLKPIIYVEANTPERFEALREHFRHLNYSVYWHCEPHWNPRNYRGNPNNAYSDKTDINIVAFPGESDPNLGLRPAEDFSDVAHLAAG